MRLLAAAHGAPICKAMDAIGAITGEPWLEAAPRSAPANAPAAGQTGLVEMGAVLLAGTRLAVAGSVSAMRV